MNEKINIPTDINNEVVDTSLEESPVVAGAQVALGESAVQNAVDAIAPEGLTEAQGPLKLDLSTESFTNGLATAEIFAKTAIVEARPAEAGQVIETILADGTKETTNTANEGDVIVRNPGSEEYIMSQKDFDERYEPTDDDGVFSAKGKIRAIKNPTGVDIAVVAPWGEKQIGAADCYVVSPYDPATPDEISADRYLIGSEEFANTYAVEKQPSQGIDNQELN